MALTGRMNARAEARRLRGEAAIIGENVADMVHTQLLIAEAHGWSDARIDLIELDITAAKATRANCIARARNLEAKAAPAA